MELRAGQIVTVDLRKDPEHPAQDSQPPEPTVLVVPMTGDPDLAMPDLTVVLQPSPSNGCNKVSYLLPQNPTNVAKTRITAATKSQNTPTVTPTELGKADDMRHTAQPGWLDVALRRLYPPGADDRDGRAPVSENDHPQPQGQPLVQTIRARRA